MINAATQPAPSPRRRNPAASLPAILLLSRSGSVRALGAEIQAYGLSVAYRDWSMGAPSPADLSDADLVIVETLPSDQATIALVREADLAAIDTKFMVIDRDFDAVDRIVAYETGVDDCVPWPCSARELVARIRAICRRRSGATLPAAPGRVPPPSSSVSFAGWTLDRPQRYLARAEDAGVTLPPVEFAILDALLRQPRRIVERAALLEASAAAAHQKVRDLRSIDIQIGRLRRRLETEGDEIIRTVRGSGYMLVVPVIGGDDAA